MGKLGDSLREKRTGLKLSLRRLASRARVSANYISLIEKGQRFPSSTLLRRLALLLRLDLEEVQRQTALERAPEMIRQELEPKAPSFPRLRAVILDRISLPGRVNRELQSVSLSRFELEVISVMTLVLDEWLVNNLYVCHRTLNKYAKMGLLQDQRRVQWTPPASLKWVTALPPSKAEYDFILQYPEVWEEIILELLEMDDRVTEKLGYGTDLLKTAKVLRPYASTVPVRWGGVEEVWLDVWREMAAELKSDNWRRPLDPQRRLDERSVIREVFTRLGDPSLAKKPLSLEKLHQQVADLLGSKEKIPKEIQGATKELGKIIQNYTEYEHRIGNMARMEDLLVDPTFRIESLFEDMGPGTSLDLANLNYEEASGALRIRGTGASLTEFRPMFRWEFREARLNLFAKGIKVGRKKVT